MKLSCAICLFFSSYHLWFEISQGYIGAPHLAPNTSVIAGVVDVDYRGEIQVLLINNSHEPLTIQPGDRIA
jgi:hypothetical protein